MFKFIQLEKAIQKKNQTNLTDFVIHNTNNEVA